MRLLTSLEIEAGAKRLIDLLEPAAALSQGEFTSLDLVASGMVQEVFIFISEDWDAVLVTQIVEFFNKKVMFILALAGKAAKLYKDKPRFDFLCKELDCEEVRCACQVKQAKAFRRHGFHFVYGIYGYSL